MIILKAFQCLWNFAFLSQQNSGAFFLSLVHYQQVFMPLLSAFRRRRRRLRLNRADFRNHPWSKSPRSLRPAESWFEVGTMYRTSLSFFLSIFLVAACTTFSGFDNSNGRSSTRWSRLFSKLPPVTEPIAMVRVRHTNKSVAQIARFPQNENWGSDRQGNFIDTCLAHDNS